MFPISYSEILNRVQKITPSKYSLTRNYINGAVTYLSPYISRGVLCTKMILSETLNRGYAPEKIEKFIQELAWRDYWQQIWVAKGDEINSDIKHHQEPVSNYSFPKAILNAATHIKAIDRGIEELYATGYMHNHIRMYVASIICNIGRSYWKLPAQWMYYHLLDADWASNVLSWQWIAGANSNKKYVANQDNINKYCFSSQKNTFLDTTYESLSSIDPPEILQNILEIKLKTTLPLNVPISIDNKLPSYIYNFYNLDPNWNSELSGNRILLLEPSHFRKYPISSKTIEFIISLGQKNIPNIKVFVGEFNDLLNEHKLSEIYFKEHPLNSHYKGTEQAREWMFEVKGYYSSFFSFWKKCKKELDY